MDGQLEKAFRTFDKDGSDSLDEEELHQAYESCGLGTENLKKAIKLLDTNGDGVIDLDEFKAIALHMQKMQIG